MDKADESIYNGGSNIKEALARSISLLLFNIIIHIVDPVGNYGA